MSQDPDYLLRAVVCCPSCPEVIVKLQHEGFIILQANDLNETLELLRKERYHMVLVDSEITKEKQDMSVDDILAKLVVNFSSTHYFILCGSALHPSSAESFSNFGIHPIFSGKKYLDIIPNKIRSVINMHRAAKLDIRGLELKDNASSLSPDEQETQWVISHLLPEGNVFFTDEFKRRKNSMVLRGRIDDLSEPLLIKIGRAQKIDQEINNYSNFIHWRLGTTNYAFREKSQSWKNLDIGGILYTFLGSKNPLGTFSEYYIQEKFDAIIDVLNFLFDSVLRPLYSEPKLLQTTLFDAYDRYLNLTDAHNNSLPDNEFGLPDPMKWILSNKEKSNLQKERLSIYQARTHGDLWGENVLIERHVDLKSKSSTQRVWLIDFERAGWGHILRDFAELEVDILTRLARFSPKDTLDYYELTMSLAKPSRILERTVIDSVKKTTITWLPDWTERVANNSEAQKAFKVIEHLRYLATSILNLQYSDAREYYWGLLSDSLFVAANSGLDVQQRRHASMYASVLAGRLERWGDDTWAPDGWPKVEFKKRAEEVNETSKAANQKEHMV